MAHTSLRWTHTLVLWGHFWRVWSSAHLSHMSAPASSRYARQKKTKNKLLPSFLFHLLSLPHLPPQYLGKTHNFWHGSAMLLEQRAYQEGELPAKSKEPPDYDGKYTDQILDPLKYVRVSTCPPV